MEPFEIVASIFFGLASAALIVFMISIIISVKLEYKKLKMLEKELEDENVRHK